MTNKEKVMKDVYKTKTYDNNECPIFDARSVKYFGNECVSYVSDEFIKKARISPNLLNKFFNIILNMNKDEAKSLFLIRIFLLNGNWDLSHLPNNDYPTLLVQHLRGEFVPLVVFNEIIQYKLNICVPDTDLNWFKKDLRASLFIAYLMKRKIRSKVFIGKVDLINNITESLKYRVHIFNEIYEKELPNFLYYRDVYGDEKTAHIEFVKYLYLKNRTAEKELSWVNSSNKKQIDWMYDYLDDKIFEKIILKRIFFPENTNEKYQQILASLDILSNVPDDKVGTEYNKGYSQRSYVIASMRNAWRAQTNYRKIRPSIEERYVKIYKENYEKLDEIAKSKELTVNQIIKELIEQEYERTFLDSAKAMSGEEKQRNKATTHNVAKKQCSDNLSTITKDIKQKDIPIDQEEVSHVSDNQEQTADYTKNKVIHTEEQNENFIDDMKTAQLQNNYQDDYQTERQFSDRRRGRHR